MANTQGPTHCAGGLKFWKFTTTSYVDPEIVSIGLAPFLGAYATYTGGAGTVPIVPLFDTSTGRVFFNGGAAGFGVVMTVVTA